MIKWREKNIEFDFSRESKKDQIVMECKTILSELHDELTLELSTFDTTSLQITNQLNN